MKTMKGPAHLSRAVRRRRAAVQLARRDCPLGRWPRLQGRADPDLGRARRSTSRRRPSQDLLRRRQGHARRRTASRSPSCRPICRASSSPFIRPTTTPFDGFAAAGGAGQPEGAAGMGDPAIASAAQASRHLGLTAHVTFSGALAWPYLYPWPQRPAGLIETAFDELARRWRPILDAFDEAGVDVCYEIHPGEDLHDGATFELFLERGRRPPALPASTTTRATSCCSSSTISPSSISTTSASRPST